MPTLTTTNPDVRLLTPTLVLLLRDGFTGDAPVAGSVLVNIGPAKPTFTKGSDGAFVFATLPNGDYLMSVRSDPEQPYYLPVEIPITLPFVRPSESLWNPLPVWPGYPDLTLSDPDKTLDDPEQPAAYLIQRALSSLQPTTSYPFPAGATLLRGVIRNAGVPLSGAIVTTSVLTLAGTFSVVVLTPGGVQSAAQNLTVVNAPILDSIDPTTILAGTGGLILEANGDGLATGAVVKLNGVAAPTTVEGSLSALAQVAAARTASGGTLAVTVVNPDGSSTGALTLTVVAAPVMVTLSPASVTAGSASFVLTIQGQGFTSQMMVQWNGVALPTTFISDTEIEATVAAVQVVAVSNPAVTVSNPGPPVQSSNSLALHVVSTPVISSIDPQAMTIGNAAISLTVVGSGFVNGCKVRLNGTPVTTAFSSATQLSAQVSAAQLASVQAFTVTVLNPDNSSSNGIAFNVVATPVIASLDPSQVSVGGSSFLLEVEGSAFPEGAQVLLNGAPLSTTFISNERLDAHVPRSGYTTGADGAFVLYFDDISGGSGQTVSLIVTHPSFPHPVQRNVLVVRGATASVDIDMASS